LNIGVLSLQGNFNEHIKKLKSYDVNAFKVKNKYELYKCDGLIIPGGESTTMSKMLDYKDLRSALLSIKDKINFLGTCAGMILLSKTQGYKNLETLSIMDFEVLRNGWGRQIFSFNDSLETTLSEKSFTGTFIRAPKVTYHSKQLNCLSYYNDSPVILTDGRHLACSFHIEYSSDNSVYEYFFKLISN
tara:strand:- start:7482 stop:8045 length:564 start_codon:yes stop_codon:yes gene_type:complete